MFINLSNHPCKYWEKKQLHAAAAYGEIYDLPFPVINPAYQAGEVMELAGQLFKHCCRLMENSTETNHTVHVMGEQNLCFLLVQLLLHEGITCVASTSERKVQTEGNKRMIEFEFYQFRPYKLI